MKDGFIKVAAGSIEVAPADIEANRRQIEERLIEADASGVNLLVLPELCLTGATLGDLYHAELLLSRAEEAAASLAAATRGRFPVLVFGLPIRFQNQIYSCAAVAAGGELLGLVPSAFGTEIFAAAPSAMQMKEIGGVSVAFGRDILFRHSTLENYAFGVTVGDPFGGSDAPLAALCENGGTILLNPAAIPERIGASESARLQARALSARLACGFVRAGAASSESTTDFVYSSHHLIAEGGELLAENPPFGHDRLSVSEIDIASLSHDRARRSKKAEPDPTWPVFFSQELVRTTLTRKIRQNPFVPEAVDARAEQILAIQAHGLARRVSHIHAKGMILGISGGLDSTLALLVSVRVADMLGLPRSEVHALTMPGFGTTARTKSNAVRLCEQLGVRIDTVDITGAVRRHFEDIGHDESIHDVTYENAQARERTQILMDMANREGSLVVGTGDLSELALGWATYGGDALSMYGVNASIPKTLMQHIVRHEAERLGGELREILLDILGTPISPELLPADESGDIAQKTEDLVGPYELHDFFLYYMLRYGMAPRKLYRLAVAAFGDAYDGKTLIYWLRTLARRFFTQQFKRSCLPDGPAVGVVGLSPRVGFRMPSDASAALWLAEIDSIEF